MAHPGRPDLTIAPSISSALAMEQQQQQQQQAQQSPLTPQHDGQHSPVLVGANRKRKKVPMDGEEAAAMSEPRRLRRSHEACSRCRSKKIKCDSKHPRCTACASAGVQCNQEDRHRKTLTPRGHVEKIERQLLQCQALLRRRIPGFSLDNIESIMIHEGLEVEPSNEDYAETFHLQPASGVPRPYGEGMPPPMSGKAYPYPPPPPHMMHPGYPPMGMPPPPGYPGLAPYPPIGMAPGAPAYDPRIHPSFQPHALPPPPPGVAQGRQDMDIKGQDPQSNDMSNDQALAKNFGVSPQIVTEAKLASVPAGAEMEDLAVGSGGLSSGRDRDIAETKEPREVKNWHPAKMQHFSAAYPGHARDVTVWLPKDRKRTEHVVHAYFSYLNYHRPVLEKDKFMKHLEALYDNHPQMYDPGYICCLYLVLALGTMSELNKSVGNGLDEQTDTSLKKLLAPGWPEHEEFFERALAVKPDLRMTISSLQALILLHWYLYTERQQRSLWRLVGSLVRVAVELGLHHNPFQQGQTFTDEESQLRIRLWSIVMIHDRGTSILLGRPLAISPADTSTPHPTRGKLVDFSEHFFLSAPVAEIQADIVNALYSPTRHTTEAIMRNATRIIKSMVEFRKQLPESYGHFFGGTDAWTIDQKRKLVEEITEDQGLTLLKVGIARILLLRAIFSSGELPYAQRRKALTDAIVASHNIIVVHHTLIKFADVAFFVSPIPLHIAAMVILYGQMSQCDRLPRDVAIEDIWFALDMLPRFRWRWERKDMNGGHPLIEKLAEKVLAINLGEMKRSAGVPVLIPEDDWEASSPTGNGSLSPIVGSLSSPKHARAQFSGSYASSNSSNEMDGKSLAALPAGWFWPMDPENPVELPPEQAHVAAQQQVTPQTYQPIGTIGCAPSQGSYILEEKDPAVPKSMVQNYMNRVGFSSTS